MLFSLFAIANQLPGFSISRLANMGDFLNANIFFKCKLNIYVSINNRSIYLCSMLLETSILLSHLFFNVGFELIRLIESQNKTNIEINSFWIRLRFVKYRFVRYWFRFVSRLWLDTDIPNKHFVCLQDVLKTSSIHVFKTSSRHVFKTSSRPL